MKKTNTPAQWATMPAWFSQDPWILENKKRAFIKNVQKCIALIQLNMDLGMPKKIKKKIKKLALSCANIASAIKLQWSEMKKQINNFTGSDYNKAGEVLQKFEANFGNHI